MLSQDVASVLLYQTGVYMFTTSLSQNCFFFPHQMRALFTELWKVMGKGDNIVIVSQFTSMLDLVHKHLKEKHVKCLSITGSVPVKERMALVDQFNGSTRSTVSAFNF
jgi:SNF2 family DNA or RNA helicase